MALITRFNPFDDLRRMEARLFEPFFRMPYFSEETQPAGWNPAVDVLEEQERIVVKVEAPGVEEKDLRVTFEDGLLTIAGERRFEQKDDRNYHRIERAYGTFNRTFTLPRSVDGAKITASYRNGVLEVEIPKKEESRPKQIQINVNAGKQLEA
ncbi:MAG TPA: Hsp20/alpha crystallin family protein [Thermoanaerobaculia bacterium]